MKPTQEKYASMLEELIDSERLTDDELESFTDMQQTVKADEKLTKKQREFITEVHERLELSVEVGANLVSTGKVKVSEAERRSLSQFLSSIGPRPLKPPGVKVSA